MNADERRARNAQSQRRYMARNPGLATESTRKYRAAHPERTKAAREADYAKNSERYKAGAKAWSAANPERVWENRREWASLHRSVVAESRARWEAAHPGYRKALGAAHNANRRAALNGVEGQLSVTTVLELWNRQPQCVACGDGQGIDHLIPLSRGGSNTSDNLQNLCHRCNAVKGRRLPAEVTA